MIEKIKKTDRQMLDDLSTDLSGLGIAMSHSFAQDVFYRFKKHFESKPDELTDEEIMTIWNDGRPNLGIHPETLTLCHKLIAKATSILNAAWKVKMKKVFESTAKLGQERMERIFKEIEDLVRLKVGTYDNPFWDRWQALKKQEGVMTEPELVKKIAEAYIVSGRDFGKVCLALIKEAGYVGQEDDMEEEQEELRRANEKLDKELPPSNGKFSFQR